MYSQTPTQELTPRRDIDPDLRFEIQYSGVAVNHPAAVEHLINWLDAYDPSWREYLAIRLPAGGWT